MKKSAILSALILGLIGAIAAAPAFAGTLYDNIGPTSNGGFGAMGLGAYPVSDSFTLSSSSTVTGVNFLVWLTPGDNLSSVDWSIGTSHFDASIGAGTATTTSLGETNSNVGGTFNIFNEAISISGLSLDAGTYWLTLHNASAEGDFVYWDISDGSSEAWATNYGSLNGWAGYSGSNSETFQILGTEDTSVSPEPSSFLLLGSGLAGLAGLVTRKLKT